MTLQLPPKSIIRTDDATKRLVHEALTSVIAGHPQARETYTFYEELDAWLGPWGAQGYPIGYGKFYNVAFKTNPKLMANPQARDWVWRTTILLQEALRDYIDARMQAGSLAGLTEPELRRAAFDSHARVYTQAGLGIVVAVAPELIPIIATIPRRELLPWRPDFGSSIGQVLETIARVVPDLAGLTLAALAGPAHTGVFRRAADRDEQRFREQLALTRELGRLRRMIQHGQLDDLALLTEIRRRLNARGFPDQDMAQAARQVVEAARQRQHHLAKYYRTLLDQSPEVRARVTGRFPYLLHAPSAVP